MDAFNITKVVAAFITIIISLIVGIRVFTLNRNNWLNRWFFLFFASGSFGFLFYTLYHLILDNAVVIIPLMITAQFFFNFICISLVVTVLILEKYEKVAMSLKYLGPVFLLFIIISFGYLIWPPQLNLSDYNDGVVNTSTPLGLLVFVNFSRIIICMVVVYRYVLIAKKLEGEARKRIQWFYYGIVIIVVGLFLNLAGGVLHSILLEIIALLLIDIGSIVIFKGFLI